MILTEIVENKRREIAERKTQTSLREIEDRLNHAPRLKDFRSALRAPGINIIAEIKRRSPSRGDILPGIDAVEVAVTYEQSGAKAISVLVDQTFFGGSLEDLYKVSNHVRVPCLCKEFIVDPYQIYEARMMGADAILLIVRILSDNELSFFLQEVNKLGMSALVETHNEEEIQRALAAGAHIIGINNRDLDTLEVDIQTTSRLKSKVPGGNILVAESGIKTPEEVRFLHKSGIDAFLIGDSLLTSNNIQEKLESLIHDD